MTMDEKGYVGTRGRMKEDSILGTRLHVMSEGEGAVWKGHKDIDP